MNPFHLTAGLPHRPWVRLGFAALGLLLLATVARQVDWLQFRNELTALDWTWATISLLLGVGAMGARALRLTWILGTRAGYGAVWRATAMGYLGKSLLPMGGGEVVKIGALKSMAGLPAASAATGVVVDRVFDLFGVALLACLAAWGGLGVHLRTGRLWVGVAVLLAAGGAMILLRRTRGNRLERLGRTTQWLDHILDSVDLILDEFKQPAQAGRILAVQMLVVTLDVASIYLGTWAFPFGQGLPFSVSLRLSIYLMLGSALPLLPSGAGVTQVACLLALQPAGVSSAGAFAYSLVVQGTGLGLACLQGGLATLWPWRNPGTGHAPSAPLPPD